MAPTPVLILVGVSFPNEMECACLIMENHYFEMAEPISLRTIFLRKEIKMIKSTMWYREERMGFCTGQVWVCIYLTIHHV